MIQPDLLLKTLNQIVDFSMTSSKYSIGVLKLGNDKIRFTGYTSKFVSLDSSTRLSDISGGLIDIIGKSPVLDKHLRLDSIVEIEHLKPYAFGYDETEEFLNVMFARTGDVLISSNKGSGKSRLIQATKDAGYLAIDSDTYGIFAAYIKMEYTRDTLPSLDELSHIFWTAPNTYMSYPSLHEAVAGKFIASNNLPKSYSIEQLVKGSIPSTILSSLSFNLEQVLNATFPISDYYTIIGLRGGSNNPGGDIPGYLVKGINIRNMKAVIYTHSTRELYPVTGVNFIQVVPLINSRVQLLFRDRPGDLYIQLVLYLMYEQAELYTSRAVQYNILEHFFSSRNTVEANDVETQRL